MPRRRFHNLIAKTFNTSDLATLAASVTLGAGESVDLQGIADSLVLDSDADTTISAPTDDQIDIELGGVDHVVLKKVATADAAATTNIAEIAFTSPVDTTGTNVHNALDIDIEVGNATGGTNTVRGIMIDAITDDAQVTTVGIEIGAGWEVGIKTNNIGETTSAAGVTIDGVLIKDGGAVFADAATIEIDTVNEATANAGVTVDGVLIKDGRHNGGRQVQAITATEAITLNSGLVTLAHDTVVIAATLDAPVAGDELFIVNNSAAGTTAHTVTLPGGVTWDGTNDVATFDAPGEALHVIALSATRFFVVANIGSVAFS